MRDRNLLLLLRKVAAFEFRQSGLKHAEVGERIWRIDGTGPVTGQQARMLADHGAKILAKHCYRHHPLHLVAKQRITNLAVRWPKFADEYSWADHAMREYRERLE